MGSDKAKLVWKGTKLIDHQIGLLKPFCERVYLSVNSSQLFELNKSYESIADNYSAIGPMGGITSALETLQQDLIVLPIDMPMLTPSEFEVLSAKGPNTCFKVNGRIEPFPSYWSLDLVRPLQKAISNQNYALVSFMQEQAFFQIQTEAVRSFKNMNHPKDLI